LFLGCGFFSTEAQRARRVFCCGVVYSRGAEGAEGFLWAGLGYHRGTEGTEGLLRCARNDGVGWFTAEARRARSFFLGWLLLCPGPIRWRENGIGLLVVLFG